MNTKKSSVVATFSGYDPDGFTHETTISDIIKTCESYKDKGLRVDVTEPGDSEYLYLAKEDGRKCSECRNGQIETEDGEDSTTCEKCHGSGYNSPWSALQDVTVSGIMTHENFESWIQEIGAFATEDNTMGTLGGPLSDGMPYCVPDINFRMEERYIIESIRVTPFIDRDGELTYPKNEQQWERIRASVIHAFGN